LVNAVNPTARKETPMRVLLRFSMPAVAGNRAIADGRIGRVLGQLAETHKPESTYFMVLNRRRTGFMVLDLADPSQIPVLAEPLFVELEAEVEFVPVMTPAELQAGLAKSEGKV
jgi:hypothetical protein